MYLLSQFKVEQTKGWDDKEHQSEGIYSWLPERQSGAYCCTYAQNCTEQFPTIKKKKKNKQKSLNQTIRDI